MAPLGSAQSPAPFGCPPMRKSRFSSVYFGTRGNACPTDRHVSPTAKVRTVGWRRTDAARLVDSGTG
eukprot:5394527-Prymnesium_polylepis.1